MTASGKVCKFVALRILAFYDALHVLNGGEILHQMKLFLFRFVFELNTENWSVTNAVIIFCLRYTMTYILRITKPNF